MSQSHGDRPESSSVRTWLRFIFADLERRGVNYVCLRVDESLLEPNREIDILVSPRSLSGCLDGIVEACQTYSHLRPAFWRVMPRHAATVVLAWEVPGGGWDHYFFDIRCGIRKQGRLIFSGAALRFDLSIWDEDLGLRRLRDDYERALLLIRNAVDKREFSPRHLHILETRTDGDLDVALTDLGWTRSGEFRVVERAGRIGRMRSPGRVARSISYAVRTLWARMKDTGSGLNIIFYGPDGVGKSTQAELLAAFYQQLGIRKVDVFHHLTRIDRIGPRPKGRGFAVKKRVYRSVQRPWMMHAVVLASYLKKLWVVARVIRPLLRRGHVVIHDRYLLDVFQKFLQARGIRLSLLERLLPRLGPREPLVFVLRAPAETIAARTGELTAEEVVASYSLLEHCLASAGGRLNGWFEIDASNSESEVHLAVLDHVLAVQNSRLVLE